MVKPGRGGGDESRFRNITDTTKHDGSMCTRAFPIKLFRETREKPITREAGGCARTPVPTTLMNRMAERIRQCGGTEHMIPAKKRDMTF